ncbi:MAG: hypothetical protein ACYTE8_12805, partial [Planctomycetota bacterium]
KVKAGGKGHQQQLVALDRQVVREQQKHLKRKARLDRIRQLAVESGDEKSLARVDKLVGGEQTRYDRKTGRMEQRRAQIMQLAAGEKIQVEGVAEKGPGAVRGKGKDRTKPDKVKGADDAAEEAKEKAAEAGE